MANAFNMLRSNDLIWPYVINNYLRGKAPMPFDLLYWNSDATRMPAANHSFYLRNCYLDNKLTKGEMTIAGVKLDLGKVTVPVYNLATREDHIAPAKSAFLGSKFFGGPVRFVLVGLRPHRRRGQSAGQGEVPVLDRRQGRHRHARSLARRRPRSIPARGGRTGSSGSSRTAPTRCRRASPAAASSRRSRTRRGGMSRSEVKA